MECKKCGKEISNETHICPECGEPTEKNLKYENNPKKGGEKILLLIVLLLVFVIGLVVILPNFINRQTYVEPQTTEEQTTKQKSEIAQMADSIKSGLEEKGYTDVSEEVLYYNFQDFVNGAKNNPDDFFFIGTTWYDWSTIYSNTKYYTNKDALKLLDEGGMTDSKYLFTFTANKKDKYGKEVRGVVNVLINYIDYESNKLHYWTFTMFNGDEPDLNVVVISAIKDKCEYHLVK